jgi:hypothetical protein
MDEVSNKTLATLLVVAIVISLAGTFFAMRGVSQITNIISGAATSPTGTAKVNITEVTSISLYQNTVDFGSGYRNATIVDVNSECNLTTNASMHACWVNQSAYDPNPFVLENDGNTYVNVTVNSSNVSTFLSGTVLGGTRRYQYVPSDSTTGPFAAAEDGCKVAFSKTDWTEFSETPALICSNMSPYAAEDTFHVDVNISIPAGVIGEKTAVVTFTAMKSLQS